MPKTKLVVDEKALRRAIKKVEGETKYTSQNAMFDDAAKAYNAEKNESISGMVVRSRALEFNVNFKTAKGKRGKKAKEAVSAE